MRTTKMSACLGLLLLAALAVITPARAVQSGPAVESRCRAAGIPGGGLFAAFLAPIPPQGDTQGCCVIKSGAQNQWQYVYTTSQNCTQMARNANVSYSFYPNTDCGNVKPK